ncbi:hypothetical protein [Serratia quinivorans]|uniref:hypothetical protein n=1 Tax=Serratia quinivorans TaxID=137545 RepID=UPI0021B8003F|nr:hypothetical protein [Serratia quinivorans]
MSVLGGCGFAIAETVNTLKLCVPLRPPCAGIFLTMPAMNDKAIEQEIQSKGKTALAFFVYCLLMAT